MAMPMVLQRVLVRMRIWVGGGSEEVSGIVFVGHPDFEQERLKDQVLAALAAMEAVDADMRRTVADNLRVLVVTETLKNVLAPYGAGFLPGSSAQWRSTRELGAWLVWVSEYIRASRENRLTRRTAREFGRHADQMKEDFESTFDLFFGQSSAQEEWRQ